MRLPLATPSASSSGPGAPSGSPSTTRRSLLGAGAGVGAGIILLSAATPAGGQPPPDFAVASRIRAEYLHGWTGYTEAAWGEDEVRPVSRSAHAFFAPGRTFGLSIVEALDTLHLMGEDREVERCCAWIEEHFDPAQDTEVQVFESVIRLVGGLLAGYRATGRSTLLARARELGDRLLPAFTASPTGIPYTHVNLRTGAVRGTAVALAEAGSNAMEFGLLSRLTGDPRYIAASMRAYSAVIGRRSSLDLLGTRIHAETGRWLDSTSSAPDPPVDSFYEYLWGGGALLGDRRLTAWYHLLTDAVVRHQSVMADGRLWFRPVDFRTGRPVSQSVRQSELGSFYAGLLAKGGDLPRGAAYLRSWAAALQRHPVLPETIDCTTLDAVDVSGQLRPEFANSAFDLWRLTGDDHYKRAALRYFDGMRTHQRVPGGYTVVGDVTAPGMQPGDLTPGYWFAENLKYLWLMFSGTPRFDYRGGILSTEGKVLTGFRTV